MVHYKNCVTNESKAISSVLYCALSARPTMSDDKNGRRLSWINSEIWCLEVARKRWEECQGPEARHAISVKHVSSSHLPATDPFFLRQVAYALN